MLFAAAEEFGEDEVEVDRVFLEGADGVVDGDYRRDYDDANAKAELQGTNGAEAVAKDEGNRGGEGEVGEELDDEGRLGRHEHRHKVKWQDHGNDGGTNEGRSVAGGGNQRTDKGADAGVED